MPRICSRILSQALIKSTLMAAAFFVVEPAMAQSMNKSVIEMIKAGLPESVIISSIVKNRATIDTSPSALIALKKAGASDAVLQAIAGGEGQNATPANTQSNPYSQGGSPAMAVGVLQRAFLIDGANRIELQSDNGATGFTPIPFSPRMSVKFPGPKSASRTTNHSPDIQISLASNMPPGNVTLVRLSVDDNRSMTLKIKGGMMSIGHLEAPADKVVALTPKLVPDEASNAIGVKVWRFTPNAPLTPGEYAIATAMQQYFSFGID